MAALLPLAYGSVRGFLCVPGLQGSGQNQCTHVPSPRGQRSPTSVSTCPLFRALTLLQTFWCSHSDPEPARPRVAPHPGWQTEVQRARPRPQAVPVPTAQIPWGLCEAGGQGLPPFWLGPVPGSPLLGVEAVLASSPSP